VAWKQTSTKIKQAMLGNWESIAPGGAAERGKERRNGSLKPFYPQAFPSNICPSESVSKLRDYQFRLDPYGCCAARRAIKIGGAYAVGKGAAIRIAPGAPEGRFRGPMRATEVTSPLPQGFAEVLNKGCSGWNMVLGSQRPAEHLRKEPSFRFGLKQGTKLPWSTISSISGAICCCFWGARNIDGRGFRYRSKNRPTNPADPDDPEVDL